MDIPVSSALDIPGRRLGLLRALSQSLARAQTDLLAMNLESFERQTAHQRQLCEALRACQAERNLKDAAMVQPGGRKQELAEVQTQLFQQARVYAALLRRTRRTVDIFCRVLATSGVTYAMPMSARPHL